MQFWRAACRAPALDTARLNGCSAHHGRRDLCTAPPLKGMVEVEDVFIAARTDADFAIPLGRLGIAPSCSNDSEPRDRVPKVHAPG